MKSAASALERAALRVLNEARRSGSVTVKAREDLAEALGLPREAARGRWHGWHGGTGEAAAKERLERAWGDRYEQDAKAAATPRWRNYEFDLGGYREAVEEQQRLLLVATEASKKLDAANEIVKEYEDKLRRAMENAMGECRVYAKERAGVQ